MTITETRELIERQKHNEFIRKIKRRVEMEDLKRWALKDNKEKK